MEAGPDYKTILSTYISQYKGLSRFTRLLRLAETSQDVYLANEAIFQCIQLAKSENMLG